LHLSGTVRHPARIPLRLPSHRSDLGRCGRLRIGARAGTGLPVQRGEWADIPASGAGPEGDRQRWL